MIEERIDQLLNAKNIFDLSKREINLAHERIALYYLTSLIDTLQYNEIIKILNETNSKDEFINHITIPSVSVSKNIEKALYFLFVGSVLIIYQETIIIVDIRLYQNRGISEPESEKSIRGNKDGFVESLISNISLIRRRIKDEHLYIEHFIIGEESKMSIAICYLENKVDKKLLKCIQEKINKIKINSLIMTDRSLEEILFKQQKTIFPLVRYTERPDVASISIIRGKIVILVDTSSSSIIFPTSLFDYFMNVEEYREVPFSGTLTRFLRSLAIILSLILIPLFIGLTTDKDVMNNIINLNALTISKSELGFQVIASIFILEIFRIASIHTPSSLVSGVSFVAAIILGEISMNLGVFLPEILLVVSISMICSFATPSYELSLCNRIIMYIFTIVTLIFGFEGLLIAFIVLFLHLLFINAFNYPYLYPLCPFHFTAFKEIFQRRTVNKNKNL